MKWQGKLIGAALGLLLSKRIAGLVIGLILGHLWDMGVFTGSCDARSVRRRRSRPPMTTPTPRSASPPAPATMNSSRPTAG